MRAILLTLVLILSGCSHTFYLDSLPDAQVRRFENQSRSRPFEVHLADGGVVGGTMLQARADSILWHDLESNHQVQVASAEVEFIRFNDRVAGGVEGFMLGFIGGAIVGGAAGYLSTDECTGSGFCFGKEGAAVFAGGAFGLSVGLFGGIYGSLRGTYESYYPGSAP